MAYNALPTVTTGDLWTAANHNTYIKDNFAAGVPDLFVAKGDLAVGTGADTAGVLTAGTNAMALVAASGEATGLKWKFLQPVIGNVVSSGAFNMTSTDWHDVTSATVNITLVAQSTIIMWASGTLYPNSYSGYLRGNIDGTADTIYSRGSDVSDVIVPFGLVFVKTGCAAGARTVKLQCKTVVAEEPAQIETWRIVTMGFPE